MKNLLYLIIILFSTAEALSASYTAQVNVFSNENKLPRQTFRYYIDFKEEIDLASLKMSTFAKKDKSIEIPLYVVPISKYKAFIYFMPERSIPEDGEANYVLNFNSGKWDGKAQGSNTLKKDITPNLVPNYSFEKITKTIERFLTWDGRTSVIDWRLQDFGYRFASLEDTDSTCRVSKDEALEGALSLCFKNGKPRPVKINGKLKNVLISGSAYSTKDIYLKPSTVYRLSFFMKITKRIENDMNFQGAGVSLTYQTDEGKNISGGIFSALYSISSKMEEEYLNKWVYIENCDITTPDTRLGRINIAEKISGITYIDMIELREIKSKALPEIIVGPINKKVK